MQRRNVSHEVRKSREYRDIYDFFGRMNDASPQIRHFLLLADKLLVSVKL